VTAEGECGHTAPDSRGIGRVQLVHSFNLNNVRQDKDCNCNLYNYYHRGA
jgi:hypothetical protein